VEFYQEGAGTRLIGEGTLLPGSSPAQYQISLAADSHGPAGEVRTYFAGCVGQSAQDPTKEVPSFSRPVRVRRQ
jgi:hypothetical protein